MNYSNGNSLLLIVNDVWSIFMWYPVKLWCCECSHDTVFPNLQKPLLRRLRSRRCLPATTPLRISGPASFQNQGEGKKKNPITNQIIYTLQTQITVWNSNGILLYLSLYRAYVILKPEFAFPLSYYLIPFTGVVGMIIIVMCVVLVSDNNMFYFVVLFTSPMVTWDNKSTSHYSTKDLPQNKSVVSK